MNYLNALKTTLLTLLSARIIAAMLIAALPSLAHSHDIPSRVTVYAFVKPEGNELTALLRVPMEALGEISFPLRGPGFIQFSESEFASYDAARVYITESLHFYENGVELTDKDLQLTRISLPSNRSFVDFETALANIQSPPLDDSTDLFWRQGVLDVLVTYPIESEDSDFSVNPELGTLSDETTTVLRFLVPNGAERVFNYLGNPGLVELDPRWHQAALRFITMGFEHILEGIDHLLFLFCLVIPLRSIRALIPVVTSFTIAHSITLIGSAFGVAPSALWFPPLIETLIALSIVYMAFENIVGAKLEHRWVVTFGFGLVHGFGFSFLFSETLQFAGGHLFSSLLAFNIGVELGQLFILILVIPILNLLFKYVVQERIGAILLSALLAHSAWHWMVDRGTTLSLYQFQMPVFDALFWAAVMRWGMMLIVIIAVLWAMYEVFRKFALIESFSTYNFGQKIEAEN
ncbi:MAG: HupE/UreJ family protein [Gammaproteobacteria bacterium]|nr:HupE/UreJ family protein [Gammaproteobacteria bacterium]